MLTDTEQETMQITVVLVNQFKKIVGDGDSRYDDLREFVHHIHAIQNMILSQSAAREYPQFYRLMGE